MPKLIISIILAIMIHSIFPNHRILPFGTAVRASVPDLPVSQVSHKNKNLTHLYPYSINATVSSCAEPTFNKISICKALEQQILASTVRLEWHFWKKNDAGSGYIYLDGNTGYATIKDGRYLVTHNHIGISLTELGNRDLTTVSIFAADGKPLFLEASLKDITIAVEDTETLVFDFGSYADKGLFESLGLTSANFVAWESLPLQPRMEVAQIDWDGATAHVEWVMIEDIVTEQGIPRLELDNFVRHGASGGGVFWNGLHIANNWSRITVQDEDSGKIIHRFSVAALNSPEIVAQLP
jgi:hypothetical protein